MTYVFYALLLLFVSRPIISMAFEISSGEKVESLILNLKLLGLIKGRFTRANNYYYYYFPLAKNRTTKKLLS